MREPTVSFDLAFVERIAEERARKRSKRPVAFVAPVITFAGESPAPDVEAPEVPEAPTKQKRGRKSESAA